MKECSVCHSCFQDHVLHCPHDGYQTIQSLAGEPTLDGRYLLEKRLGQGGMGIVYRAHHVFLRTSHAIKVILPELVGNDPSLVTRFRQEAMAAAAIRHPNVVLVTDYGIIRGIMPFLVMEFIQGRSLHEVLAAVGKLSPAQALDLMSVIASGISAAHNSGIVHRDLKPLNIMIQDNKPLNEAIKILDFGLAKIKSGEWLGSFVVAQTIGMVGSPSYMAPELWSDEEPDHRADIYSLGIILFQMLAGDVPFKGVSVPTIMKKHLLDPPPPFSALSLDVPPEVERVVHHALEKDPNKRPASTDEFIRELREAVQASERWRSEPTIQGQFGVEQATQRWTAEQQRQAEEIRRAQEEAAARQRAEEEARRRAEEERQRQAAEEEARRKAEAERLRLEEEARLRALEEQRRREEQARLAAEEEARRKAEEEARRRADEERQRAAAEAERQRLLEEQRRREEEERRAQEARRQAELEAQRRAEEEARRKAEEEARLKAEAEARRQAEEEARRRAEEEAAKLRSEEEARRFAALEEERRRAEETARRAAEEESRRKAAEEEARRQAAEEERLRRETEARKRAEEEARLRAEEEARRRAEEERQRLLAEQRRREEEEARRQAELEAQRQAEEQARQRQAEEAQRRAAEDARRRAEETATRERQAREDSLAARVRSDELTEQTIPFQAIEEARRYTETKQEITESEDETNTVAGNLAETRFGGVVKFPTPAATPADEGQQTMATSQRITNPVLGEQTITSQSHPSLSGQVSGSLSGHISSPSIEPTAGKKSFPVMYIAAAVLLLVLGGGGIYFFTHRATEAPTTTQQNPPPNGPGGKEKPSGNTTGNSAASIAAARGMVYIAGGTFQMGRNDGPPNERPAHSVTVQPFYIDKTEVTNAQYAEFVQATGHPAPSNQEGETTYWKPWNGDKPPAGQEQWPVRNVSVTDAEAYAGWLSKRDGVKYRLPTEEEWEYVARDGAAAKLYPWGNNWASGNANLESDLPKPVGSYSQGATSTGVLDLIGNVWEWTSSKASLYNGQKVPPGEQGQAVRRGGSYRSQVSDNITATYREWLPESTKHPTIGFRLVLIP